MAHNPSEEDTPGEDGPRSYAEVLDRLAHRDSSQLRRVSRDKRRRVGGGAVRKPADTVRRARTQKPVSRSSPGVATSRGAQGGAAAGSTGAVPAAAATAVGSRSSTSPSSRGARLETTQRLVSPPPPAPPPSPASSKRSAVAAYASNPMLVPPGDAQEAGDCSEDSLAFWLRIICGPQRDGEAVDSLVRSQQHVSPRQCALGAAKTIWARAEPPCTPPTPPTPFTAAAPRRAKLPVYLLPKASCTATTPPPCVPSPLCTPPPLSPPIYVPPPPLTQPIWGSPPSKSLGCGDWPMSTPRYPCCPAVAPRSKSGDHVPVNSSKFPKKGSLCACCGLGRSAHPVPLDWPSSRPCTCHACPMRTPETRLRRRRKAQRPGDGLVNSAADGTPRGPATMYTSSPEFSPNGHRNGASKTPWRMPGSQSLCLSHWQMPHPSLATSPSFVTEVARAHGCATGDQRHLEALGIPRCYKFQGIKGDPRCCGDGLADRARRKAWMRSLAKQRSWMRSRVSAHALLARPCYRRVCPKGQVTGNSRNDQQTGQGECSTGRQEESPRREALSAPLLARNAAGQRGGRHHRDRRTNAGGRGGSTGGVTSVVSGPGGVGGAGGAVRRAPVRRTRCAFTSVDCSCMHALAPTRERDITRPATPVQLSTLQKEPSRPFSPGLQESFTTPDGSSHPASTLSTALSYSIQSSLVAPLRPATPQRAFRLPTPTESTTMSPPFLTPLTTPYTSPTSSPPSTPQSMVVSPFGSHSFPRTPGFRRVSFFRSSATPSTAVHAMDRFGRGGDTGGTFDPSIYAVGPAEGLDSYVSGVYPAGSFTPTQGGEVMNVAGESVVRPRGRDVIMVDCMPRRGGPNDGIHPGRRSKDGDAAPRQGALRSSSPPCTRHQKTRDQGASRESDRSPSPAPRTTWGLGGRRIVRPRVGEAANTRTPVNTHLMPPQQIVAQTPQFKRTGRPLRAARPAGVLAPAAIAHHDRTFSAKQRAYGDEAPTGEKTFGGKRVNNGAGKSGVKTPPSTTSAHVTQSGGTGAGVICGSGTGSGTGTGIGFGNGSSNGGPGPLNRTRPQTDDGEPAEKNITRRKTRSAKTPVSSEGRTRRSEDHDHMDKPPKRHSKASPIKKRTRTSRDRSPMQVASGDGAPKNSRRRVRRPIVALSEPRSDSRRSTRKKEEKEDKEIVTEGKTSLLQLFFATEMYSSHTESERSGSESELPFLRTPLPAPSINMEAAIQIQEIPPYKEEFLRRKKRPWTTPEGSNLMPAQIPVMKAECATSVDENEIIESAMKNEDQQLPPPTIIRISHHKKVGQKSEKHVKHKTSSINRDTYVTIEEPSESSPKPEVEQKFSRPNSVCIIELTSTECINNVNAFTPKKGESYVIVDSTRAMQSAISVHTETDVSCKRDDSKDDSRHAVVALEPIVIQLSDLYNATSHNNEVEDISSRDDGAGIADEDISESVVKIEERENKSNTSTVCILPSPLEDNELSKRKDTLDVLIIDIDASSNKENNVVSHNDSVHSASPKSSCINTQIAETPPENNIPSLEEKVVVLREHDRVDNSIKQPVKRNEVMQSSSRNDPIHRLPKTSRMTLVNTWHANSYIHPSVDSDRESNIDTFSLLCSRSTPSVTESRRDTWPTPSTSSISTIFQEDSKSPLLSAYSKSPLSLSSIVFKTTKAALPATMSTQKFLSCEDLSKTEYFETECVDLDDSTDDLSYFSQDRSVYESLEPKPSSNGEIVQQMINLQNGTDHRKGYAYVINNLCCPSDDSVTFEQNEGCGIKNQAPKSVCLILSSSTFSQDDSVFSLSNASTATSGSENSEYERMKPMSVSKEQLGRLSLHTSIKSCSYTFDRLRDKATDSNKTLTNNRSAALIKTSCVNKEQVHLTDAEVEGESASSAEVEGEDSDTRPVSPGAASHCPRGSLTLLVCDGDDSRHETNAEAGGEDDVALLLLQTEQHSARRTRQRLRGAGLAPDLVSDLPGDPQRPKAGDRGDAKARFRAMLNEVQQLQAHRRPESAPAPRADFKPTDPLITGASKVRDRIQIYEFNSTAAAAQRPISAQRSVDITNSSTKVKERIKAFNNGQVVLEGEKQCVSSLPSDYTENSRETAIIEESVKKEFYREKNPRLPIVSSVSDFQPVEITATEVPLPVGTPTTAFSTPAALFVDARTCLSQDDLFVVPACDSVALDGTAEWAGDTADTREATWPAATANERKTVRKTGAPGGHSRAVSVLVATLAAAYLWYNVYVS